MRGPLCDCDLCVNQAVLFSERKKVSFSFSEREREREREVGIKGLSVLSFVKAEEQY